MTATNQEEWLSRAEHLLGYRFKSRELLMEALTHRSFINENKKKRSSIRHNERLEFLGDAVLGLVTADFVFRKHADEAEGELTRRRAAYVSEKDLAKRGLEVAFGDLIRMGKGQRNFGGEKLPSIVADAMEAVFGAVFLDGGLEGARAVIHTLLGEPSTVSAPRLNAKTIFQERVQKVLKITPTYHVSRLGGPDHAPTFDAELTVKSFSFGKTDGPSRQAATAAAAQSALDKTADLTDEEFLTLIEEATPDS